ncbi:interleukin-15 [Esox lucius]|uniref:Interleukin n=1 Tax=Esox lucius TaxID=8010 RepID=A0AAY5KEW4_ESOLU|nr:interleukin-15 [Esox lucius]
MTGFLTVLLLLYIFLRERKKRKSVQCICVFWGFHYYQHQCPNIEARDCFILLSCLVAITCMPLANANGTEKIGRSHIMEVQQMLDLLKSTIENSNASLYSPTNDEIQANCTFKFMHCYLLELEVILIETFDKHETTRTEIHHMKKLLERQQQFNSSTCLPCEAQTVANSTTFLKNFEFLLKRINNTL